MFGMSFLSIALLLAQTTTTTKSQSAATKPRSTTARPTSTSAAKPAAPAPMTDEQKTIYALGLSIAQSIGQFDLSPAELEIVKRALTDAAAGKPAVELSAWGPKIQGLAQVRAQRVAERTKAQSQNYLAKAATESGAVKLTLASSTMRSGPELVLPPSPPTR